LEEEKVWGRKLVKTNVKGTKGNYLKEYSSEKIADAKKVFTWGVLFHAQWKACGRTV